MKKLIITTVILTAIDLGVKLLISFFVGTNIITIIPNYLKIEPFLNANPFNFRDPWEFLNLIIMILVFLFFIIFYKFSRYFLKKFRISDSWIYFFSREDCAASLTELFGAEALILFRSTG